MSVAIIRAQQGFSLIEVSIVSAIVLLLAIIGVPAIGGYLIENKVPKVGEELARFILQTKINAPTGTSNPYEGIEISNFANLVRDSSVFTVSGTGAGTKVLHGLGTDGEVGIDVDESTDSFEITLSKVNNAACPSIASVMQRVSDSITIAPDNGAAVVVKDASQNIHYSALTVESKCARGDVNTFVFTAG